MKRLQRESWLDIINAAFLAGRPDTARSLATDWLTIWPGDTEVSCLLAKAEYDDGQPESALARLKKIWITDPEYVPAYELAVSVLVHLQQFNLLHTVNACAAALKSSPLPENSPAWGENLGRAYALLQKKELAAARAAIEDVLALGPSLPLPTWIAARIYAQSKPPEVLESLLLQAQDRWPECVPIRLLMGQQKMRSGETTLGVELIHRAAAEDPTGSAAGAVFGDENPYSSLWPSSLEAPLSSAVPAAVSAVLGENLLPDSVHEGNGCEQAASTIGPVPAPKNKTAPQHEHIPNTHGPRMPEIDEKDLPKPEPWEAFQGPNSGDEHISGQDALENIKAEFEQLAQRLRMDRTGHDEDGRSPSYIILSSRTRLLQAFGQEDLTRIEKAVVNLALMVRRRPSWTAHTIYVDDPKSMGEFKLSPVDPGNPWQIKLRLVELDEQLRARGEMIGALLIVGGGDIIPFHQLPNPTPDDDDVVYSDNPYAATDENYYAPEWPVGRFPSARADEMLQTIHSAAEYHRNPLPGGSMFDRITGWLARVFNRVLGTGNDALGYSADIWRKAAMDVFRVIGSPRSLKTSPPVQSGPYPPEGRGGIRFSYFNLHGLEDSPEWFGQRDPFSSEAADEFPVAIRPSDILNSGAAPEIVFTEACYGANTVGKTSDSAISLRFLASGSRAVIGSTKISYGSVTTPLIAADLLTKLFWTNSRQQIPVGEALRQAKLKLAAEMHERQGFLDGEDQKTLTSFVLYGDPLYTAASASPSEKSFLRSRKRPEEIKVMATPKSAVLQESDFDPNILSRVKTIMTGYLPGMSDAECTIHSPTFSRVGQSDGPGSAAAKVVPGQNGSHYILTFSKDIHTEYRTHAKFARVTVDGTGRVMKLAVSK